jgi:SAM-dependent methyltransferase
VARYVIRGGEPGKARMRLIAAVLEPTTEALLAEAGLAAGMHCLDVGCGGGDVTTMIAGIVGATGRVVGIDMDPVKIELARQDAAARGAANVEFRVDDASTFEFADRFELVYARFVLTHVGSPDAVLARMVSATRTGGIVVVEDVDHTAVFSEPASAAVDRWAELYNQVARRNGGDPAIGPKLPALLRRAGLDELHVSIVQPVFITGPGKRVHQVTLANVADALITAGLATAESIAALSAELDEFTDDGNTLVSFPRVFQAYGRKRSEDAAR